VEYPNLYCIAQAQGNTLAQAQGNTLAQAQGNTLTCIALHRLRGIP